MDRATGTKIVERVNQAHPKLLRYNTHAACGEFVQRVCLEPECRAERIGLLSKSPPENGHTFPNGIRTSHDVIAWPNGERCDIIQSAAGHPAPAGPTWQVIGPDQWRPSNVYVDISSWPLFDSGTPDVAGDTSCVLAFGWFCWMRAWADWEAECKENEAYILGEIGPTVYRVMLAIDGLSHTPSGYPDWWRDAGVRLDGTWDDRYKRMLDHVGAQNRQMHCTVYGGRNQTPTEDSRRRFHDRIVAASSGRWQAIRSFEMMNEFQVNRWTPEEVRSAGRDLRSKVPAGTLIALSSPDGTHGGLGETPTNEEMESSFDELYGGDGAGANLITIHTMRDGLKWSDPFSYNAFYAHLKKVNNEPPGPGSSAGGMFTTAGTVAQDFNRSIHAGWAAYVGHSEWSVWNGHLPTEYHNGWREVKFLKDLPNMAGCAHAMKSLASGLDPDTGTPPPTITPPAAGTGQLLSGQALLPDQSLHSPGGTADLRYQGDGNLVSYLNGEPHWSSETEGESCGSLQMQPDGNLVLYSATQALRSTRTSGHPGAICQVQDDGNFVVYADPNGPEAGTPLWASATEPFYGPMHMVHPVSVVGAEPARAVE